MRWNHSLREEARKQDRADGASLKTMLVAILVFLIIALLIYLWQLSAQDACAAWPWSQDRCEWILTRVVEIHDQRYPPDRGWHVSCDYTCADNYGYPIKSTVRRGWYNCFPFWQSCKPTCPASSTLPKVR